MIGQAHIVPRFARCRGSERPIFVREFCVRNAPLVIAIPGDDGIARMRAYRALGRSHNAFDIREANLDLALEFPSFDTLRVAGNFGGESDLAAAAKYQRIVSIVVLPTLGIIHNAAAEGLGACLLILADLDPPVRSGFYFVHGRVTSLIES